MGRHAARTELDPSGAWSSVTIMLRLFVARKLSVDPRRARGFGMHVLHTTSRGGIPLEELLARSDVVTLHCPLTAATRHLIDGRRLAQMKPGAILINTSRGPVVDEEALAV